MVLLSLLFSLIIWGLIFYICWWGLGRIGIAEPFNKIAVAILVIASVVVIIGLLTGSIAPFYWLKF